MPGVTIRSQSAPLLSATSYLSFLFFLVGEQVEQPLQPGGACVQVLVELCPGFFPAAAQRVQEQPRN
jgi:hypothetical protein